MLGKLSKLIREIFLIIKADKINAHYLNIPAKDNRVNIYEYHPELLGYNLSNKLPYNLGDSLGKVIIKYLLEQRSLNLDCWVSKRKHINCVGSNIFCSYQNTTIWGSGVQNYPTPYKILLQKISRRKLDIRAVRGPLSKQIIEKLGHKCPDIYGDPAILMPFIYNPIIEKKYKYSIIPQFVVEDIFRKEYPNEHIISMNTDDYEMVINEIKASDIIYSSSLHGIILAEAYGVPAVFFRGLDKCVDFKYLDYYYSTGRKNIEIAESFEEAMKMTPLPLPDLSKLQKGLLESFPYDLWMS